MLMVKPKSAKSVLIRLGQILLMVSVYVGTQLKKDQIILVSVIIAMWKDVFRVHIPRHNATDVKILKHT